MFGELGISQNMFMLPLEICTAVAFEQQYALCFITNTKSTCVSAEFTNQFDCYFMSIHMKFLSFFLSCFLSFCSFSHSLNVLHCLPFIDDVTYAVYSQAMTQISTCAYRQIL